MNTAECISQEEIFGIASDKEFLSAALRVFHYQYAVCQPYQQYCDHIHCNVKKVTRLEQIPFLPIQLFKSHQVINSAEKKVEKVFKSSGTGAIGRSEHHVVDLSWYEKSFLLGFQLFHDHPNEYTFIALLPSYMEQGDSSLVYMVQKLVELSADARSGFYNVNEQVVTLLNSLEEEKKKTMVIGVTYALLDLIDNFPSLRIPSLHIMETGGMKGRRKELPKNQLHQLLKEGLGVDTVYSEYGMTELLSQGYSKRDGVFQFPPWMKIILRESNDPFSWQQKIGKAGGVNVIDLANVHSCSFIATQDLGKWNDTGLQIVGRFDHSDIRGCNLMMDLN
jgi:hypothetical protein